MDGSVQCFPGAEACNGRDDDCDGVVDDVAPTACAAGRGCVAGRCECLLGATECGGACVDTARDDAHCGGCGHACDAGFACLDGVCRDEDECALGTAQCEGGRACVDREGGYDCGSCPAGFREAGPYGCEDIDECATDHGGCDPLTACDNEPGGRSCSACPPGYAGTGATGCVDVDECALANGGCDPRRSCLNLPGGHSCGACSPGYEANGATGCRNVDECRVDNGGCDPRRSCVDLDGSFACGPCAQGYALAGDACVDRDECATGHGGCDARRACINTTGGHYCGACDAGFVPDGPSACRDLDECATDHGGCHPLRACHNLPGSFVCGDCSAGYEARGATDCADVDECTVEHGGCDPLTACVNRVGGFACGSCPHGYQGDGAEGCVDLDECAVENGGCDALTGCTNLPGGRACSACPAGYESDGDASCLPRLLDVRVSRRARLSPELAAGRHEHDLEFDVGDALPSLGLVAAAGVRISVDGVERGSGELFEVAVGQAIAELHVVLTGAQGRRAAYALRVGTGCAVVERTHFKPLDVYAAERYGYPLLLDAGELYVGAALDDTDPDHVGALYRYTREPSGWALASILRAPGAEPADFGGALAQDGDWLMVGAAFLAGRDPSGDAMLSAAGGVYVYHREAWGWELTQTVRASNPAEGAAFGLAIALSGDVLAVGATGVDGQSGALYVFEREGERWVERAVLAPPTGSGARFGAPLAFASGRLLAGVPFQWANGVQTGAVYMFTRDPGGWHFEDEIEAPAGARNWGDSLSVSPDGRQLAISDGEVWDGAGALSLYTWSGSRFEPTERFAPEPTADNERYGSAVAFGDDWLAIGAPYAYAGDRAGGYVELFRRRGEAFTRCGRVRSSYARPGQAFGSGLRSDGAALFVSDPGEHSNARGINGTPTVRTGAKAGAVFELEVGAYNLFPR